LRVGGDLKVESTLGGGTWVRLEVPVSRLTGGVARRTITSGPATDLRGVRTWRRDRRAPIMATKAHDGMIPWQRPERGGRLP
jgi:hypothetical protein